jgi:serine/threonine protein kinase
VLVDFGFASQTAPGMLLNSFPGTFSYAAPEVLSGKPYDGTKSDAWSLAVTLYAGRLDCVFFPSVFLSLHCCGDSLCFYVFFFCCCCCCCLLTRVLPATCFSQATIRSDDATTPRTARVS